VHPFDIVEVRNRYDGRWAEGFEVIEERPAGYLLRRRSDGAVLPELPSRDVRPAPSGTT
jgi:hypothetical protein